MELLNPVNYYDQTVKRLYFDFDYMLPVDHRRHIPPNSETIQTKPFPIRCEFTFLYHSNHPTHRIVTLI